MGLFDLFSKKQRKANQAFLAEQRSQQAIAKIKKMALPADLKQQLITAQVYDIWFSSKDLAPLVELLNDQETIEYAALGINEQSEAVMLVCTNENLLILTKKHTSRIIPLKQIKSVLLKPQLSYDELTLIVNNKKLELNSINKTTAPILADAIKKWSQTDSLSNQVQQIKQLKELVDQGILTEEEFQAKKKQILKI